MLEGNEVAVIRIHSVRPEQPLSLRLLLLLYIDDNAEIFFAFHSFTKLTHAATQHKASASASFI